MQTHHLPVPIPAGLGTTAYWSTTSPTSLVVFVHGFGGAATGTWRRFPSMFTLQQSCTTADIIYFGYDSRRKRSLYSALDLYHFLDRFVADPIQIVNPHLPFGQKRCYPYSYQRILLIGHSLGAVVSRQTLIEACQNSASWKDYTQLVLFAPAHRGANVIALAHHAFPIIGPILMFRWQALLDLAPRSETLLDLDNRSAKLLETNSASCLVAKKIVLGDLDKIISPLRFLKDPTPIVFPGKNHSAVCKPTPGFPDPISEVVALLP